MIPRVNLGASALNALINNKNAVAAFPFLKEAPKVAMVGCGGCSGRKIKYGPDRNWLNRKVASLSGEQKKQLRQLLNAKQVAGYYREKNGRRVDFAF